MDNNSIRQYNRLFEVSNNYDSNKYLFERNNLISLDSNNYKNTKDNIDYDKELKNKSNLYKNIYSYEKSLEIDNKNNNMSNKSNINNKGEITGDIMDYDEIDKGMPYRSQFNPKKNEFIYDTNENYSRYTDFDIFDESKESNKNISYFDPNIPNASNLEENIRVLNNSDPNGLISDSINNYGLFMYDNIRNLIDDISFCYNYGIFILYSCLFAHSNDLEIKNFFNMYNKDICEKGVLGINKYLDKSECLDIKNIIFYDKNLNSNIDKLDNVILYEINKNNIHNEINNLNLWINKTYGNILKNVISGESLMKVNISLYSVGLIRTVWKIPFVKIISSKFYGFNSIDLMDFMQNSNNTYLYFEDNTIQAIELPFYDNILSMIIILPKIKLNKMFKIDIKDLDIYMNNLKPTLIDELLLPKFTKHFKLRYSNILKKCGLKSSFQFLNTNIFNQSSHVSDVAQNIILIVDEKCYKNNEFNYSFKGKGKKMIINKPFFFCIRIKQTNTNILNGFFS